MKLNLGCGWKKRDGWINVDRSLIYEPDLLLDIEGTPWCFQREQIIPGDSVEKIALIHVLEHVGQDLKVFLGIMKEMYRVLIPGGSIELHVPHPRSDAYMNAVDHVRPITIGGMEQFSKRLNLEWKARGWANTPLALMTGVNFEIEKATNMVAKSWQDRREVRTQAQLEDAATKYYGVIDEIQMILVKV